MKQEDIYYQAMLARDYRFDGKFFVGVKTTGIYCRPICPAKPKRENVEFFSSHIDAEKAGFRPCMRCRPESAPQSPAWIGKSAVVRRAVKILNSQDTIEFNEDQFAEQFGVTARHLRRLFAEEIGKTPKQLFFENRLNLARKLLIETALPITEVAFSSGFSSIRRFNDAFKDRFKKSPGDTRRTKATLDIKEGLKILIPYRPPFDFDGLIKSYENHRIGNLEWFEEGKMHRVISMNGKVGQIAISNDPKNASLIVEIDFPDTSIIHTIITRVRNLFDLSSDPVVIANVLEVDVEIKKLLKQNPGVRLPSGWDPFEVAISAILGQLVSIEFGRSLVYDLIEIASKEASVLANGKMVKLFPTPKDIIAADLTSLKTTRARKQTLLAFCSALCENKFSLESTQDVDEFLKKIQQIKGIGPWTAHYIALKALRNTDTFPASDLILARALEKHSKEIINKMSPWRGYVAALFWLNYANSLKKKKAVKK
ncbi:MAG: Ada metal-binding domain-containing protein [Gammaproteobacteria bacterium]|nr:Ada metal-binding domain-containing protein [Gammaproteobacteria bacterium]